LIALAEANNRSATGTFVSDREYVAVVAKKA